MKSIMPAVINIDSRYDWRSEARKLWDEFDWDRLAQTAPGVSEDEWSKRRDELVLVGLCSSLTVNRAYGWDLREGNNNRDRERESVNDHLLEGWRKRQRNINSNISNHRFDGEEPHFRSPKLGGRGVVECYGIYVSDWTRYLKEKVEQAAEKAGVDTPPKGPAIFLCPERIVEIYPTLMTLDEKFQRPLPLSCNPTLVNLKMLLLHEMGHHFFPVHKSGVGKYISEGFANRFCLAGIEESEKPWLLYKTWRLQPPEYSAYRFLNLLIEKVYPELENESQLLANRIPEERQCVLDHLLEYEKNLDVSEKNRKITYQAKTEILGNELDEKEFIKICHELMENLEYDNRGPTPPIELHCYYLEKLVIMREVKSNLKRGETFLVNTLKEAFHGSFDGLEAIFSSMSWEHIDDQSECQTMAIALDLIPTEGFLADIRNYLTGQGKETNLRHFLSGRGVVGHREKDLLKGDRIPADFLFDLYQEKSIYPWVLVPGIPDWCWVSWGTGSLDWPGGPLSRYTDTEDCKTVLEKSPYWAKECVIEALRKTGGSHAVKQLADTLLNNKDATVRRKSAYALGKIGDPSGIEPLKVALEDKDYSVRVQCAYALGKIGDPSGIEPLKGALEDKDYSVREASAEALGQIGDISAVKPLIAVLQDKGDDSKGHTRVREAAIKALGAIGDKRAIAPLQDVSQDDDEYLRIKNTAKRALEALGF